MNAEERHRLHENDLEKLTERVRPVAEKYWNIVAVVVAGLLLVTALAIYFFRSQAAASSTEWGELTSALTSQVPTAEQFENIAEAYPGSPVAVWAQLNAADARLRSGLDLIFTDRDGALRDLSGAGEQYEQILADRSAPPMARERALFGSARVLEATSDGDMTRAISRYEELIETYPESVYKQISEERVASLENKSISEFYAWYAEQNPKPADLETPQDGPSLPLPAPAESTTGEVEAGSTTGTADEGPNLPEIEFPDIPAPTTESGSGAGSSGASEIEFPPLPETEAGSATGS
ncbi:tetratricopeptide repeat protein [Stratiformator vulcanicus]|uniref:Tetratricopeptide repeat-like domain-containing protein n=1 Tax=Stratiformator vulcanicus TaxID=2527980 RepID=A0A517R448_9PLAN|nr:hypothetical protein [Stratiformator vulcanicus]QDT38672.1 hypothetical protein Pan189_30680 [Stratiformator vulcanicus]